MPLPDLSPVFREGKTPLHTQRKGSGAGGGEENGRGNRME